MTEPRGNSYATKRATWKIDQPNVRVCVYVCALLENASRIFKRGWKVRDSHDIVEEGVLFFFLLFDEDSWK